MARGEGVKKLSDLFESYKKRLRAPQKTVVSTFCEVVTDVLGVTLKSAQVRYTPASRTLVLQVGGPMKSEILLQKESLLIHMKGRLGPQSAPHDII